MKKLIAIILVLVIVLSLCACTSSKNEAAVLWAGSEDHATQPNSLLNAMDRAMYIENIDYNHYAAGGDQAKQTQQATECLNAGCSVLLVELVDASAAQSIVDLAKAKNVPVIFFGTEVDAAVVASYDKCAAVSTDDASVDKAVFDVISSYILENTELTQEGKEPADDDLDLDDDGKINFVTVGQIALQETLVIQKNKDDEPELNKDGSYKKAVELVQLSAAFEELKLVETEEEGGLFGGSTVYRQLQTSDGKVVELVLVADDQQAMDTLIALQAMGMNSDKLATCFVPVFTVGADADYKAYVMENLPADAASRSEYLAEMAMVADMTALDSKEWDKRASGEENEVDAMIFNTFNQIDTGRLSGTAVEDYDAIAEAAANLAKQLLKSQAVEEAIVKVAYTVYPE